MNIRNRLRVYLALISVMTTGTALAHVGVNDASHLGFTLHSLLHIAEALSVIAVVAIPIGIVVVMYGSRWEKRS